MNFSGFYEYRNNKREVHLFEKKITLIILSFMRIVVVFTRNTKTDEAAIQGGKGLLEWNEFAVVIRILSCHVVENESFKLQRRASV